MAGCIDVFEVCIYLLVILVSKIHFKNDSPVVSLQSSHFGHSRIPWPGIATVWEIQLLSHSKSGQEQAHSLHPKLLLTTWKFCPTHCLLQLIVGHWHLQTVHCFLSSTTGIITFPCFWHLFLHKVSLKFGQLQSHQNCVWHSPIGFRKYLCSLVQVCWHVVFSLRFKWTSAREKLGFLELKHWKE